MSWKRRVSQGVSQLCALALASGPRRGFRILLYHAVGSRLAHDSYGISIDPARFARHMSILAETYWLSVVGLSEGLESRQPLRVAVTFDDGYRDTLETAAPILQSLKIPFTVFVTTSNLENDSGVYLSARDLQQLAALPGVTIGAHGHTHTPLASCDDGTLWNELDGSRRRLEDLIGRPVRSMSYPHGSVNGRIVDAARRAGYAIGACSRFDINRPGRDPLRLCRTEVLAADTERVFIQKLAGAWDWCRWRKKDPATS
jgi:peptidoglycan/xylan/chitin deacetylase (PgdA/CDA1 family)